MKTILIKVENHLKPFNYEKQENESIITFTVTHDHDELTRFLPKKYEFVYHKRDNIVESRYINDDSNLREIIVDKIREQEKI